MKKLMLLSLLAAVASPLFAQGRMDLLVDAEGVRRTGSNTSFVPGTIRFEPTFATGGGVGVGLNFFLGRNASIELKAAQLESNVRLRIIGSDSVQIITLGREKIYPLSAILQWHPVDHGTFRPYLGAGVVHTIFHDVNKQIPSTSVKATRFRDPTGLVVDGGLELAVGKNWSAYGDARFVPLETKSRATFVGTNSATDISVRPLIVSAGLAYHFGGMKR